MISHCNCGGNRSQTLIWSRYCWLTAGARMGSGWRCRNVICISMSRHSSRCFVAYSFEIRRHNFHRKDNKHGKTSFSQGRMYNEGLRRGFVLSLGTPPLVAAVASVAEVVFWHLKRSVLMSNNNARKMSGIFLDEDNSVGCRWLHLWKVCGEKVIFFFFRWNLKK